MSKSVQLRKELAEEQRLSLKKSDFGAVADKFHAFGLDSLFLRIWNLPDDRRMKE